MMDGPGEPVTNMERDTALFDDVLKGRLTSPVVRIYAWTKPAVTVGRLQMVEAVQRAYPAMLLVRRPTGGRAVVHGNDLTLSVATRDDWLPGTAQGVMPFYRAVAEAIAVGLAAVGVDAALAEPQPGEKSGDRVDCFEWAAGCDLVEKSSGRKLVGCAQRCEGGAVLLQASIPGIVWEDGNQTGDRAVNHMVFTAALREALGPAIGVDRWVERTAIHQPAVVLY